MYYEDGKVRGRKWVTDKRCDEYLDGLVEFRQSFGDEQASRQWFVSARGGTRIDLSLSRLSREMSVVSIQMRFGRT